MKRYLACLLLNVSTVFAQETSWIRINQLGYPVQGSKVAVWCSKQPVAITSFSVIDAVTKKTVFTGNTRSPEFPRIGSS